MRICINWMFVTFLQFLSLLKLNAYSYKKQTIFSSGNAATSLLEMAHEICVSDWSVLTAATHVLFFAPSPTACRPILFSSFLFLVAVAVRGLVKVPFQ